MKALYTHAIVLDFEATCDDKHQLRPQEIIEFPSILLTLNNLQIVDEFRSFVRPHHNPTLTSFCREFTSITQEDIDQSPEFPDVLVRYEGWLDTQGLTCENSFFVTCGDWDLGTMLPAQCKTTDPPLEVLRPIYRKWLNIKVPFCYIRKRPKAPGMAGMLKELDIPLTGQHHCGIDDCQNIVKIFRALVQKSATPEPTTELPPTKCPPINLRIRYGDLVESVTLKRRSLKELRRLVGSRFKCPINSCTRVDGTRIVEAHQLVGLQPGEELILK